MNLLFFSRKSKEKIIKRSNARNVDSWVVFYLLTGGGRFSVDVYIDDC